MQKPAGKTFTVYAYNGHPNNVLTRPPDVEKYEYACWHNGTEVPAFCPIGKYDAASQFKCSVPWAIVTPYETDPSRCYFTIYGLGSFECRIKMFLADGTIVTSNPSVTMTDPGPVVYDHAAAIQ